MGIAVSEHRYDEPPTHTCPVGAGAGLLGQPRQPEARSPSCHSPQHLWPRARGRAHLASTELLDLEGVQVSTGPEDSGLDPAFEPALAEIDGVTIEAWVGRPDGEDQ